MEKFERIEAGSYDFVYEKELSAGEENILQMPKKTKNGRTAEAIGWQSDGDVTLYGTFANNPEGENTMWQQINENEEINKAVSAIKIVAGSDACRIVIRAVYGS